MKGKKGNSQKMSTLMHKLSKQTKRLLVSNNQTICTLNQTMSMMNCNQLDASLNYNRPVVTTANFNSMNDIRSQVFQICRDYLYGLWKNTPDKNYNFHHIRGGLSNWLYHVWIENGVTDGDEPRHVLVRIYGQTHADANSLESLLTECVIFTLLSERGLGPKLYGIFQGGRIEEYIANGRSLEMEELSDASISVEIAKRLAAIHEMQVPLSKEPTWLWETMRRWLKVWHREIKDNFVPEKFDFFLKYAVDFDKEYDWLKDEVEKYSSEVVFCHNDLQEGNILLNQSTGKLVVIDFEYCAYNYRSFDIANHFLEWTYNYTVEKKPNFEEYPNEYPTVAQQTRFIEAYLKERNQYSEENVARILKEVKFFSLLSHFFWSIWSIVNATKSQIPFGFWDYCVARLNAYVNMKKDLMKLV